MAAPPSSDNQRCLAQCPWGGSGVDQLPPVEKGSRRPDRAAERLTGLQSQAPRQGSAPMQWSGRLVQRLPVLAHPRIRASSRRLDRDISSRSSRPSITSSASTGKSLPGLPGQRGGQGPSRASSSRSSQYLRKKTRVIS